MARARQEGSSPEPVEGLARDGPRPFPLSRLVPSAVSCGLCEPGLPAAPAAPALLPAAYLCAPTAPPAVTAALGAPRWPGGPRSRPRGPRPDGPQPSLSPAEQHLESPVPSAPGALAGGPTQAAPGVRGEEEQWAREIGAQLRRMADDLNALYERRVSAGGGADGRWDFPLGRGLRRPSQMCGSCCPARRGRAGDRQLGGAAWSPSRRRRARGAAGTARLEGRGRSVRERRCAPGASGRGD
ncbi:bcl-2-binding component 3 isoform X2 [Bos taurus]|nr:bcl-2-binding component 3 isoform X2 [Bos taurus]XP_024834948.2 bcl-2-binding component 3 isoform X2 [Bos taurus]